MNIKNNTTKEVISNLWLKGSDFHFWPRWDNSVNMMFPLPSAAKEKQTKYMKQQIERY